MCRRDEDGIIEGEKNSKPSKPKFIWNLWTITTKSAGGMKMNWLGAMSGGERKAFSSVKFLCYIFFQRKSKRGKNLWNEMKPFGGKSMKNVSADRQQPCLWDWPLRLSAAAVLTFGVEWSQGGDHMDMRIETEFWASGRDDQKNCTKQWNQKKLENKNRSKNPFWRNQVWKVSKDSGYLHAHISPLLAWVHSGPEEDETVVALRLYRTMSCIGEDHVLDRWRILLWLLVQHIWFRRILSNRAHNGMKHENLSEARSAAGERKRQSLEANWPRIHFLWRWCGLFLCVLSARIRLFSTVVCSHSWSSHTIERGEMGQLEGCSPSWMERDSGPKDLMGFRFVSSLQFLQIFWGKRNSVHPLKKKHFECAQVETDRTMAKLWLENRLNIVNEVSKTNHSKSTPIDNRQRWKTSKWGLSRKEKSGGDTLRVNGCFKRIAWSISFPIHFFCERK